MHMELILAGNWNMLRTRKGKQVIFNVILNLKLMSI